MHVDKYRNFAELAAAHQLGRDFAITCESMQGARFAVVAPHAGSIERLTSDIARAIAHPDCSLYLFEGKMPRNNRDLHVTSHHFDEPSCLQLVRDHQVAVGIHGCDSGAEAVYVGGRDAALRHALAEALVQAGYGATHEGHDYPAMRQDNICNRGSSGQGVQLEIDILLREHLDIPRFAATVRRGLGLGLIV